MTKSRLRVSLAVVLLSLLLQPALYAQSASSFDQDKLDTYFNKLAEKDKIMGSVAIDSAGSEAYQKTMGYVDEDQKKEAGHHTKYRIGSVTKTFTAAMIFQLIEEDKLLLNTSLADFYPEIPQADSITIEHLLAHRAGLYNFTNASDYSDWMTEQRSKDQLLELFRNDEPQFSPGQQTSYSNTNYVLLGFIIEDITGQSYADQLEKRITEPLELEHTYYGGSISSDKNEAYSFRPSQEGWTKAPETDMSIPGGAGAIVSTPGDLTDFIRALFKGKVVSEESLDKMTNTKQGMGMGLMKIPFYNTFAYGHGGGIDGFKSNLSYFPGEDVALAVTTNALNYSMNDILLGTLSIYFNRPFEIPSFDKKTITLSEKQMKKYAGNYESGQLPMDIKIFTDKGTLKAQATGQGAFPLTAGSKTDFRFEPAGVKMEFDSLSNGKYQQFMLKQAGGTYLFKRNK
ncbi:serine hydrolase domain-containing protein [Fodinibius halophilus]|uniref:Beta-lactamase family protein n=1 Tax=Fodinibius halophilus TaxID=1736908 RepID=A0A6M1TDD2_9BACT|nr:serine hydrolase domain-containing protein [Fodinibius halophilus]NGP88824.1 beta-lactamase family protein [Fodinibius halophilus]